MVIQEYPHTGPRRHPILHFWRLLDSDIPGHGTYQCTRGFAEVGCALASPKGPGDGPVNWPDGGRHGPKALRRRCWLTFLLLLTRIYADSCPTQGPVGVGLSMVGR